MKQCRTTKNPCKICFQTVTKRNGLQCHGACKKWVHFQCLNFTPGKIRDIKAGFIKVMCPCPDCTSTEPKEVLVNPPYTCQNIRCPANAMPICESLKCPAGNPPKGCDKKECSKKENQIYDEYASPSPISLPKLIPAPIFVPFYEGCPASQPEPCPQGKSKSCCCISKGTNPPPSNSVNGTFGTPCVTSTYTEGSFSDSRLYNSNNNENKPYPAMECALEQMCNTVNILTQQIQELLGKFADK